VPLVDPVTAALKTGVSEEFLRTSTDREPAGVSRWLTR
jgi:hypothetical protein